MVSVSSLPRFDSWMTHHTQFLSALPGTHRVAPGQIFVLERLDREGAYLSDTFSLEELDPRAHADGEVGTAVVAFTREADAHGALQFGKLRLPCGLPVAETCQVVAIAPESLLNFGGLKLLDAMGNWRVAPWHPGCFVAAGTFSADDLLEITSSLFP